MSARIRGALSRSRQMRCFKKGKGVNAKCGRGRPEMNKKERRTTRLQERDPAYFICRGLCFAWPRRYYYHIFRIMRSRVCLLFHATPSWAARDPGSGQRACILTYYHSLSVLAPLFLCICHVHAWHADEKFMRFEIEVLSHDRRRSQRRCNFHVITTDRVRLAEARVRHRESFKKIQGVIIKLYIVSEEWAFISLVPGSNTSFK